MVALAAAAGAGIALILCLVRLFAGPTLYDRTLAGHGVSVNLAIIVASAAVIAGHAAWIDFALMLLLASLVVNVAVMKFFRTRTFQPSLARAEEM